MPTFTPEEIPGIVSVIQHYRGASGLRGRPEESYLLDCGHDARQSFATSKIEISLPPVNDYTYTVADINATLVCNTCWRATPERMQAGSLPTGLPGGYPWTKGRLPTEAEVAVVVLQDLLAVLAGREPGDTVDAEYAVAAQEAEDPERVQALRAEVHAVLDRYAAELFHLEELWTR